MSRFNKVEESLSEICEDCLECGSEKCHQTKCHISFAKSTIQIASDSGVKTLKGGMNLIPNLDMKFYEESQISKSIAQVLKLCKECKDNHSEECVLSLLRRSLESTVLKEQNIFPGSTFMYLMNVAKENPEFAQKIKVGLEL